MTLKDMYNKQQGNNTFAFQILGFCIGLGIIAGIIFLVSLLYNYIAPTWRLPQLSYLKFVGTVTLIDLFLLHFRFFKKHQKDNNSHKIQLVDLSDGDFLNDSQ